MKKILSFLAASALAFSVVPASFAEVEPTIRVDGRKVDFREDQAPIIMNDRLYVPVRRVLEKMGATVDWNDEAKMVTVNSDNNVIKLELTIDNKEIIKYTFTTVMNAEKETNDTYSKAFIENSLFNIILLAMRHGTKKTLNQGEYFGQMQNAIRYINEHYAENITLSSVARILLMEETYFSKKFKQLTGLGFKEFLIQTRIKKAEELLAVTRLEIGEIAEKCGFSSSNYFGDAFKKINGISPRQYRKLF